MDMAAYDALNTDSQDSRRSRNMIEKIRSMAELQSVAESVGSHFFSPDTMKFWQTEIVYDGFHALSDTHGVFVTKDRHWGPNEPKVYVFRWYMLKEREDGTRWLDIDTLSVCDTLKNAMTCVNNFVYLERTGE